MKKLLLIAVGAATFACGDGATKNGGDTNAQQQGTAQTNVEEGSGTLISPQLEQDSVNAERYDVDTVSSATDIHERVEH